MTAKGHLFAELPFFCVVAPAAQLHGKGRVKPFNLNISDF
jgi:hypothetical protein